jgi:hypothetical protein
MVSPALAVPLIWTRAKPFFKTVLCFMRATIS